MLKLSVNFLDPVQNARMKDKVLGRRFSMLSVKRNKDNPNQTRFTNKGTDDSFIAEKGKDPFDPPTRKTIPPRSTPKIDTKAKIPVASSSKVGSIDVKRLTEALGGGLLGGVLGNMGGQGAEALLRKLMGQKLQQNKYLDAVLSNLPTMGGGLGALKGSRAF